jgi:small conductance mechanosensitive channel
MTLTESDAAINGASKTDLAVQWQGVLQSALEHALLAEEPEYLNAQLRKLPFVIGGGILLTLLLVVLRRWLRRRDDEVEAGGERLRLQRSIVSGALWLSNWAAYALWALIVIWVLGILPVTRAFANELSDRAVRIVLLWLGLALLDRVLSVAIVRVSDGWVSSPFADADERARMTRRRPTFIRAAENLKSIVIWAVAIVATFSVFSISATSVLTIGAVVAFALSFATQSLIKDYLNGFLILVEDQFAIGDTVTINGFAGKVEDLTLRITRIRTDDGRLVTLPNSTITAVEKETRRRRRVDSPSQD